MALSATKAQDPRTKAITIFMHFDFDSNIYA